VTTFAELNLKTGQPMQLQHMRIAHARLHAMLIGYLAQKSVLVTTPPMNRANDGFEIVEGDQFVCRAFAGRHAFAFQTLVLRTVNLPYPHLHLHYPEKIEAVVIRKANRVPMKRAVSLIKSGADGEASEAATLLDLSLTGAGLATNAEIAAASETLDLIVPDGEQQPGTRLKAVIRKVRSAESGADATPQFHYGLEFIDLTPEQTRALQELIQQQLLSEV
jgi:c-di-GMP-binding flagellar brake protein YcgR